VCLRVPDGARRSAAAAAVPALAEGLGLRNEFAAGDGPPADAIAFWRRIGATSADIADDGLLHAEAVVHVASATAAPVAEFCAELARLLGPAVKPLVLGGVVRPMIYTKATRCTISPMRIECSSNPAQSHPTPSSFHEQDPVGGKDWMERTHVLPAAL
jgi:hypothetical protein